MSLLFLIKRDRFITELFVGNEIVFAFQIVKVLSTSTHYFWIFFKTFARIL